MVLQLTFPNRQSLLLDPAHGPRVMGILNLTPDSFSDGGRYETVEAALGRAVAMVEQGADIIDIGGESTRPGARPIGAAQQKQRVVGAIEAIHRRLPDLPISIDTTQSEVAAAALDAGASMINDISGGRHDLEMFSLAAERGVPIVLMHMRGDPTTMQQDPVYMDVVQEVEAFLSRSRAAAEAAGIFHDQIILDPGIGFGKTLEHNLALLAALPQFVATGHPILLGASRKRFIAELCPVGPSPEHRIGGTCAATVIAAQAGVQLVRVHDVGANCQARSVVIAVQDLSPTKK